MLIFNLKKEWFEKIKSGKKTHEYRIVKPYWQKRIDNYLNSYNVDEENDTDSDFVIYDDIPIKFVLGYTKNFLIANIKSVHIVNGKNTDLAIDKDVYDIEFELMEISE